MASGVFILPLAEFCDSAPVDPASVEPRFGNYRHHISTRNGPHRLHADGAPGLETQITTHNTGSGSSSEQRSRLPLSFDRHWLLFWTHQGLQGDNPPTGIATFQSGSSGSGIGAHFLAGTDSSLTTPASDTGKSRTQDKRSIQVSRSRLMLSIYSSVF